MSSGPERAGLRDDVRANLGLRAGVSPKIVLRLALGVLVGAAVLAVMLRGIDFAEVRSQVAAADRGLLAWAMATVLATAAAKAARWRALFPEAQRPALGLAGRALLAGQVVNFILPVRGGDALRGYLIQAGTPASFVTGLTTVAAEKVFDVLALLAVSGLTAAIAPLPTWIASSLGAAAASGIVLVGLTAALPPSRLRGWVLRGRGHLGDRVGRAFEKTAGNAVAGLIALREPRIALTACGWSALVWLLAAGTNWFVLRALDLRLGLGASLLQLIVHMAPIAVHVPGRVGEHQALSVVGLAPYNVGATSQVAFAATLYAVVYLPQVILGALSLAASAFSAGRMHDRDLGNRAGL